MDQHTSECYAPSSIYHLKILDQLTKREIDVLSCLSGGRSMKSIAQLLGINYKTCETHTTNLRQKLGVYSRDSLIDTLERMSIRSVLQEHYLFILEKKAIRQWLGTNLSKTPFIINDPITIMYSPSLAFPVEQIANVFSSVGLSVYLRKSKSIKNSTHPKGKYIYVLDGSQSTPSICAHEFCVIAHNAPSPKGQQRFTQSIVEIVARLFKIPPLDLPVTNSLLPNPNVPLVSFPNKRPRPISTTLKKTSLLIFGSGLLLCLFIGAFMYETSPWKTQTNISLPSHHIRRIGIENDISNAFKHIESKMHNPIVALNGIGGAGKSTTGRQYALLKRNAFVWEINAETHSTIQNAFWEIALTFCSSRRNKEDFEKIEKIKSPKLRFKKLLTFVQQHLRKHNWLLLFDNVESVSLVAEFLPIRKDLWGEGCILLTTRDQNISPSSKLPLIETISVQELLEEEAATLLKAIMSSSHKSALTDDQLQGMIKHLPPFPLDVSLAGHYVAHTHISPKDYIQRLEQNSSSFNQHAQTLTDTKLSYPHTRVRILEAAFKQVLSSGTSFEKILVAICFLGPENIPRALLDNLTEEAKVDACLYLLSGHSLITAYELSKHLTFAIHRSTQTYGKSYLSQNIHPLQLGDHMLDIIKALKKYCLTHSKDHLALLNIFPHLEVLSESLEKTSLSENLLTKCKIELLILRSYIEDYALSNINQARKFLILALKKDVELSYLSQSEKLSLFQKLAKMSGLTGHFKAAIRYHEKARELALTLGDTETALRSLISIGFEQVWLDEVTLAKETFTKALKECETLIPVPSLLLAQINTFLATLYSTHFLHQDQGQKSMFYIDKAQEALDPKEHGWRLRILRNKAQTLVRASRYQEALDTAIKPAYLHLNRSKNEPHTLLRLIVNLAEGDVCLRKGHLIKANKLLSHVNKRYAELLGETSSFMAFPPAVLLGECKIRLGQWEEAEKVLNRALEMKNPAYTNFHKLALLTAYCHKVIIAFHQGNQEALPLVLNQFFSYAEEFYAHFVKLEKRKLFNFPSKETLFKANKSLSNYKKLIISIFSDIYQKEHPFVKDYLIPQLQK